MSDERMRIYLAGPQVFQENAKQHGDALKKICEIYGGIGLFPLDNDIYDEVDLPAAIRSANMGLIRSCDAVVADMTPFRGPGMDGGTAYEMGVAAALGKPVVGYTSDPRSYTDRVRAFTPCTQFGETTWDSNRLLVESFAEPLTDNLMMAKGVLKVFPTDVLAIKHVVLEFQKSRA